jgi:DNA-damage-inducible protein J
MFRIADERRLPFEVKVPNGATRAAMAELEAGKGKAYAGTAEMLKDFGL